MLNEIILLFLYYYLIITIYYYYYLLSITSNNTNDYYHQFSFGKLNNKNQFLVGRIVYPLGQSAPESLGKKQGLVSSNWRVRMHSQKMSRNVESHLANSTV